MLKVIFYIGTFYMALLGILAFFLDYPKFPNIVKWILGIIAVSAVVFSLWYEYQEKIGEQKEKEFSEMIESSERREISKNLEELKRKDEKGLLSGTDYLRYVSLYLEKMDINLQSLNLKIRKDFLLDYYTDIEKIPSYFNIEEWKESAELIYRKTIDRINGDFNVRGMYDSGMREKLLKDFEKEHSKLIQAKEREYKEK